MGQTVHQLFTDCKNAYDSIMIEVMCNSTVEFDETNQGN
jgi:hypothetical protein